jgi:hypothetical protein
MWEEMKSEGHYWCDQKACLIYEARDVPKPLYHLAVEGYTNRYAVPFQLAIPLGSAFVSTVPPLTILHTLYSTKKGLSFPATKRPAPT